MSATAVAFEVSLLTAFAVVSMVAGVRGARRVRSPDARAVVVSLAHAMSDVRARAAVVVAVGVACVLVAPAATGVCVVGAAVLPHAAARAEVAAARRRAARELPDVLDAVARSLRSGSSLGQAITDVRPPADETVGRAWAALRASVPAVGVRAAADEWSVRATTPHERLAASALALAAGVGGPQARAIDAASVAVRHRLSVDDDVRTQAVQARASTLVIGAAPLAFAVITSAVDRRFAPFLFSTAAGAVLLHAGLALDAVGLWWMSRLVRSAAR